MYHARTTDKVTSSERTHSGIVRKLAGECVVLLRNHKHVLPIEEPSAVALYGNGARHTIKGGTGSGDVNSRYVVNVEQGLEEAGFTITTGPWLDAFDKAFEKHTADYLAEVKRRAEQAGIPEAMIMFDFVPGIAPITAVDPDDAKKTDTAIYVLSRDSGEGGDRRAVKGDFYLSDEEEAAFDVITTSFKKSILVLNTGGIVSLGEYAGRFSAILLIGQLGNLTGNIAADVITGRSVPSGRLTDTWCFDYSKYPNSDNFSINNGNTDDEYYTEGVYVGYRYFDSFGIRPDFPFGFGLDYTVFDYSLKYLEVDGLDVKGVVKFYNNGSYKGKHVVQFYVASPCLMLDKPCKELVGFVKSDLILPEGDGYSDFSFSLAQIANYCDECESKVLEPGEYIILMGDNALDVYPIARIVIEEKIITEKLRNVFGNSGIEDEYKNPGTAPKIKVNDIAPIKVDLSKVQTFEARYVDEREALADNRPGEDLKFGDILKGEASVEEFVAKLTVEQMAKLCVGDYSSDLVQTSNVVGSASSKVPGAAAETIETYKDDLGIPSMVLADGPAGLRLQPHFKTTADGTKIPGGEVFGMSFNPFPDDIPADAVDYYQFCTAIPIATALGQSYNPKLIEQIGRAVGEEMKEYYVHCWLAPGMNIHRNPLCGRNFEYFSEDPLLTGKCAAAMTRGVQSLGGQGTSIKHFACNNQEVNRMFSNSHVSERTIRNLYLRSFEIAVKESQPYTVMSSYNLINGTHSANHVGLCRHVLRDEWGFEGLVMTDWYTSQAFEGLGDFKNAKYPISSSVDCIKSGNDWQMPGCEKNVTDIIEAVGNGSLQIADLQFCVCNIIRMAVKCFKDGSDI